MTEETLEQTADRIVRQGVRACVSYLVSTLAAGVSIQSPGIHKASEPTKALVELADQAVELASPIPDYEEAAIQAGWSRAYGDGFWIQCPDKATTRTAATAFIACQENNLEPYDRDVFEHWIVSDWLADKLLERGEKVDKDFAGLCVWARTTTGQMIAMDSVIEAIAKQIREAR